MIVKTIGRGQGNSIVINDEKVSRTHLQMVQDDNGNISVVDVGSTNGTYVNGVRIIGETRLKAGDNVRIGSTILPWQSYFTGENVEGRNVATSNAAAMSPVPTNLPNNAPKHRPIWIFIVGGILVLMLVSGGIIMYLHKKQKAEEERIEMEQRKERYWDLEKAATGAERDAAIAAADYETVQREKAEQEKNTALIERDNAERKRAASEAARKKADKERIKANNEKNQAVSAKESADKQKAEAVKAKEDADKRAEQAKQAEQKALKEKSEAEEKANLQLQLSDEFYQQLNVAQNKNKLPEVCEKLGTKKYPRTKTEGENHQADPQMNEKRYKYIVGEYKKVKNDPTACRKIINIIKEVSK